MNFDVIHDPALRKCIQHAFMGDPRVSMILMADFKHKSLHCFEIGTDVEFFNPYAFYRIAGSELWVPDDIDDTEDPVAQRRMQEAAAELLKVIQQHDNEEGNHDKRSVE